jgi:hypothetical protein
MATANARAVKPTERSKHYFRLNGLLKLFCIQFLIKIFAEWENSKNKRPRSKTNRTKQTL